MKTKITEQAKATAALLLSDHVTDFSAAHALHELGVEDYQARAIMQLAQRQRDALAKAITDALPFDLPPDATRGELVTMCLDRGATWASANETADAVILMREQAAPSRTAPWRRP